MSKVVLDWTWEDVFYYTTLHTVYYNFHLTRRHYQSCSATIPTWYCTSSYNPFYTKALDM